MGGVELTGRIRSFDKSSVVLEANGQEQLIFKHAISTVVMGRMVAHGTHLTHPETKTTAGTGTAVVPAVSAGGPAGAGAEREGGFRLRRSFFQGFPRPSPVRGR